MATANPEDGLHVGQIADITGDGRAFAFEDWRVDAGSDRDDDVIFRVKGATGFTYAIDYDLCLKLSEVTNIYHLPQALYTYRTHPPASPPNTVVSKTPVPVELVPVELSKMP